MSNPADDITEALLDEDLSGTKLERLVDALWKAFGGPDQIAAMLKQAYLQAKEGSMTQMRILDMMVKVCLNEDKQKSVDETLDGMTEDQLEALLRNASEAGESQGTEAEA